MKAFCLTAAVLACMSTPAIAQSPSVTATTAAEYKSPRCAGESSGEMSSLSAAANRIVCATQHRRLLVVGDLHGTNQIPELGSKLVADASERRPIRLGLEIESFEQTPISTYVASKGTDADKAALLHDGYWAEGDGRASRAIVKLIESMQQLRAEGRDVAVFTTSPAYPGEAAFKAAGGPEPFKE